MDVDWNAEVIDQIESHWQHQLRPRLEGLTDDEYFWRPVPDCWTVSRRGASSAPMSFGSGEFTFDFGAPPYGREQLTTIAWRLAHLTVGFAETNGAHFGGPPAEIATLDYAGTAKEALRQLDDAYGSWVEGVRGLGQAGLARRQGPTHHPSSPTRRWRGSSCTRTSKSSTTEPRSTCGTVRTKVKTSSEQLSISVLAVRLTATSPNVTRR